MKTRWLLLVVVTGVLAVIIGGCGGSGGTRLAAPGVTLTIGVDTAVSTTPNGIGSIIAPLDPGATVVIMDFRSGSIISQGILGANGIVNLKATPGLTVVVVASGQRSGKTYRLSRIIPLVPNVDSEFVLNPATSITAEAIAQKYFRRNQVLDEFTVNQVYERALAYTQANPNADYSIGGVIRGNTFGGQGSLDPAVLALLDVPASIDNDLVRARNGVQQIREAGLPLKAIVSQERPDIEGIFTEQVREKYSALAGRLSLLILPSLTDDILFQGSRISITDLQLGKAYQVQSISDGVLEVVETTNGATAGQVTLFHTTAEGTYKLAARPLTETSWRLSQTFTGDPLQEYVVVVPVLENEPGANPTLNASISLKDEDFPTAITFNGSISAVGPDSTRYSRITFNGQLNTAILSASGIFQANFVSTVPAGAEAGSMIYDFPTSFSMNNAAITAKGSNYTIKLAGNLAVSAVIANIDGSPVSLPKQVNFSGSYNNTHSGLNFTGEIAANWQNAPVGSNDLTDAVGTVKMKGQLTRQGYPTYLADLQFNLNNGAATTTILLQAGANTLKGTGDAVLTADGVQSASLKLTNQNLVDFNFNLDAAGNVTGTIISGSRKVADITTEGNLLKIAYIDGTFDTFPL